MHPRSVSSSIIVTEDAMPHLLDPKRIDTETKYLAALDELDTLMADEPDACAGQRIDELFALIEDYELRLPARASQTD
jgi:hypothetical protein